MQSTSQRMPSSTPSLQKNKICFQPIMNQRIKHFSKSKTSTITCFNTTCHDSLRLFLTTTYPVSADTGMTMQSRFPIKCEFLLKIGLTSRTPIHSGISCLFANTNKGMPCRFSLAIILSEKTLLQINHSTF